MEVIADMDKVIIVKIDDVPFTITKRTVLTVREIGQLEVVSVPIDGVVSVSPIINQDKRLTYLIFLNPFEPDLKSLLFKLLP